MRRKGGTRIAATKWPIVVLAGEDSNDRKCLRILLEAYCPDMHGRLVEINGTLRLCDATGAELERRVERLRRLVNARAARDNAEVACVFIHEDLDRTDGTDYHPIRERVEKALGKAFGSAHHVLAVWETEAWLLLFPDALAALVAGWKLPQKYWGKDTGRLTDPKRILMEEISRSGRKYRESDAPDVLEKAIALGKLGNPLGSNRSWSQLRDDVERCCSEHISV
ncbi:hypothetical protein OHA77_30480 [Streptosporangium sp. NBC_01639]|uniref:hypothetical protein n=1 Tax=Streptosporangium sp. NBC_01639 TaxID=2975948 RepID=UPI00386E6FE8|nr:hypothetical protein OHA77_30480 [Streptosporangium sp. NBC_01639]